MNSVFPDLRIIPEILKKFPLIQAAYIFGSVAEGRVGLESVLDLAIIPLSSEIRKQRVDIFYELTKAGFDRGQTYPLIVRQYFDSQHYLKTRREAFKRRILNGPTRRDQQETS